MKRIFTFILALICSGIFSQKAWVDSVLSIYRPGQNDSLVCIWLRGYIEQESDNGIWPAYNEKMKSIADDASKRNEGAVRLFYMAIYSDGINNDGFLAQQQGNFKKAFDLYRQSLEIKMDINDYGGTASSLSNIGYIYFASADYKNAAKFYQKALKIQEENGDKEGASLTLKNLANVFLDQRDTVKYLELLNRSLKYREEIGDKRGIASCYNALAGISILKGDFIRGQEFALSALKLFEELDYKEGKANSYGYLGAASGRSGNRQMALEYYYKALDLSKQIGDSKSASDHSYHIADIFLVEHKLPKARENYESAMKYAKQSGEIEELRNAYKGLYKIDSVQGKKTEAASNLNRFLRLRDSMEKKVNIVLEEFNPDSLKSNVDEWSPEKATAHLNDQSSTLPYMIMSGLTFLIMVLIMIFFRFRKP